jgi:hypothetical protein
LERPAGEHFPTQEFGSIPFAEIVPRLVREVTAKRWRDVVPGIEHLPIRSPLGVLCSVHQIADVRERGW